MTPELEKMKKANDAKREAMDTLMEMILDSAAPEDMKIDFRLMKARNELLATSIVFLEEFTLNNGKYTTEQKTEAHEYLSLVTQGIKQYISEMAKQ